MRNFTNFFDRFFTVAAINIAQMNVTREKAGEKAIMIIEVDSRNCDESIEEIRKIPHLHNVNFFQ